MVKPTQQTAYRILRCRHKQADMNSYGFRINLDNPEKGRISKHT